MSAILFPKPNKVKPPVNPAKSDPLVKATRKAYRESNVGQLVALLSEESRWKRKETVARNKLLRVRAEITLVSAQLAREADAAGIKEPLLKRAKGGDK